MSLLFMDGFDHAANSTDILRKWTATYNFTVQTGRDGAGYCYYADYSNEYLYKQFNWNKDEIVLGIAMQVNSYPTANASQIMFMDAGTIQVATIINTSGYFEFRRGSHTGTLLATSTNIFPTSTWQYVEIKIKFHNSTGYIVCKINGTEEVNATGLDTSQTGNEYFNRISLGNPSNGSARYDDLYLLDLTGTSNNDFLGDCRVETIYPDGAGNSTQWTPVGEASNYLCVDEVDPDDDSTYVTSSGTSELDLYTYDNISVGVAEIYGIQILPLARKDAAGEVTLDHYVRVNSTDYVVGSGNMSDSYTYYPVLLEESPDTSTQWTLDEINALEVGVNRSE